MLPGLIDVHTHVCLSASDDPGRDCIEDHPARVAIRAQQNLALQLDVGRFLDHQASRSRSQALAVASRRSTVRGGMSRARDVSATVRPEKKRRPPKFRQKRASEHN